MDYTHIRKLHPAINKTLEEEEKRQREVVNLIASENYVSPAVLEALGTPFTNKYAEGKSHARYYFGNTQMDSLEDYTKDLVYKLFKIGKNDWSVNVQPYSGSIANLAVYAGLLERKDTVLAMSLAHGGHLTHGHEVSLTGKLWDFVHYGVSRDGFIDYEEVRKLAQKYRPKLLVCGASSYPRTIDFKTLSDIAKSVGAYLMADISHIAGLIAGKSHPSPFPYADIVTTTTHKTLRGPRAAIIISKTDLADKIDKAVFPGIQGGPHGNTIAAVAVSLEEALSSSFKKYAVQTVKNAKTLAEELKKSGFTIVSGSTDNHLLLIDTSNLGISGKEAGELLEKANIIVNKNAIPFDTRKPWDASGIRIGTPAVTTRGMKERDMKKIAGFISLLLKEKNKPSIVKSRVVQFASKFKTFK